MPCLSCSIQAVERSHKGGTRVAEWAGSIGGGDITQKIKGGKRKMQRPKMKVGNSEEARDMARDSTEGVNTRTQSMGRR